jgi:hypothetical protein
MEIPQHCTENRADTLIVITEHKRTFTLRNQTKRRVKKVRVDGCLINDKRIRCDYVFELGQNCRCAVYVELKGSDVGYAFQQLVATMGYLVENHQECVRICHIVASRVPRAGPKVQTLQLKMRRAHNARLYVGTRLVTIDISTQPYT